MMTICLLFILIYPAAANEISIDANGSQHLSSLERARMLTVPTAKDVQNAEYEHASFWDDHGPLLHVAWKEWELTSLDKSTEPEFLNPQLSDAINEVFANPTNENEAAVQSQWRSTYLDANNKTKPLPEGVYATQLLTPSGISYIRGLLDQAAKSGIPTRRPNGMNRNGLILDYKVNGAVPTSPLMDVVEKEIIDSVVRPVGRLLFQHYVRCNDDVEYFAFTIRFDGVYDDDTAVFEDQVRDVELNEHRDASVITLNVNLNLPDEEYEGSDVYFREFPYSASGKDTLASASESKKSYEEYEGSDVYFREFPYSASGKDTLASASESKKSYVRFTPGMAIIHLGAHRHGSIAISSTENKYQRSARYNLVIWLFGEHGDVRITPYPKEEQMNAVERWHGCTSVGGMMSNIHNFV
ncbi:hypothetical protein ACHAWO_013080 [Cyclotella atomus]|uniref:Fe2OG dioxygenase domain-containing protein n=1 Tax=Cyclotella atomus TaxID=382360 RepID=A0ABD3NIB0_9STRA